MERFGRVCFQIYVHIHGFTATPVSSLTPYPPPPPPTPHSGLQWLAVALCLDFLGYLDFLGCLSAPPAFPVCNQQAHSASCTPEGERQVPLPPAKPSPSAGCSPTVPLVRVRNNRRVSGAAMPPAVTATMCWEPRAGSLGQGEIPVSASPSS